jgi:hypothetical protein
MAAGLESIPLFLFLASSPISSVVGLSNGTIAVEVNDRGVLVRVPASGLRTVDGPAAKLLPGFAEWAGVSFEAAGQKVKAVASGVRPDWAGRTPVVPVSLVETAGGAVSVARAGDLEIRTEFRFDPDGPYLLAAVTLVNVGSDTLHNLFYTREIFEPGAASWTFPYDFPDLPDVPPGVRCLLWMIDDLPPGASGGVGFSYTPLDDPSVEQGIDVPLSLWTGPGFPSGVPVGLTNGISWGDYDADGWIDFFALKSGNLWRNLGGTSWMLAANLLSLMPSASQRYGSSFGDYDNDGLPDIGTEPRKFGGPDTCFHLLHNLGGGPNFMDVANNPAIVDLQPCGADSETICWGDVDADANLDMFLPVYPPSVSANPGNFFLYNLGPTGPAGAYRFTEISGPAGLDNPPGAARPEGAQFVDADFDGDLDLYSNGTLYQNVSAPGTPDFDAMTTAGSGIGFANQLDEGAMFFDYDLDGDPDLVVVYTSGAIGVRIWEAYGDGTFFAAETSIVQSPFIGLNLGMSAEDWDNDGDVDFTTRQVFRRNMLVETGNRLFVVATHTIPASFLTSATPAWGDWDKDGDLDCALGNWLDVGHFYHNTTYGPATALADRRYLRVRPLRDSAGVPAGLETEYAACAEVHVAGEEGGFRRRKFTSSAGGYLNQNEYTPHFALPADPDPGNPAVDVTFDVSVDFPNDPDSGLWRVDEHVNPLLGNVDLAGLADREISVLRSGRVRLDGCDVLPAPMESPLLETTGGGLALPAPTVPLPAPAASPTPDRFVGIAFDTLAAADPVRVTELVFDGQLDAPVPSAGSPFNVALWDVTDALSPAKVESAALAISPRNRRTSYRVNWVLDAGRQYRLVARATTRRGSPFVAGGPGLSGIQTSGGLDFADPSPETGAAVVAAPVDPATIYLAVRHRPALIGAWVDLGNALPGSLGTPVLSGTGRPVGGSAVEWTLRGAPPNACVCLVLGDRLSCEPFAGGIVLPEADFVFTGLETDANGELSLAGAWPDGVPSGTTLAFQMWIADPGAASGLSASNALWLTTP